MDSFLTNAFRTLQRTIPCCGRHCFSSALVPPKFGMVSRHLSNIRVVVLDVNERITEDEIDAAIRYRFALSIHPWSQSRCSSPDPPADSAPQIVSNPLLCGTRQFSRQADPRRLQEGEP